MEWKNEEVEGRENTHAIHKPGPTTEIWVVQSETIASPCVAVVLLEVAAAEDVTVLYPRCMISDLVFYGKEGFK